MSDTVIEVANVSKLYRLGEVGTGSFKQDINRWIAKLRGKEDPYMMVGAVNDRTSKDDSEYVWALKDVSFDVKKGDVLGIIGKNGAGKSTLLKILSRTTSPSTGTLKAKGRIASLLEVGTGFQQDLSGRDNIYLNGAILGMTKAEISRKFDEIVAFAGVERYIDTPVKRYSSGMYVRLAFAVAAHLESEILIIDEVLAVGDLEFQKKCFGKIGEVSQGEGKTVLFVSHNMPSLSKLCNKGVYLHNGQVHSSGKIEDIINDYITFDVDATTCIDNFEKYKFDNSIFSPVRFGLFDENGNNLKDFVRNDEPITLSIQFELKQNPEIFTFGFAIYTIEEELLFWSFDKDTETEKRPDLKVGINEVSITLPTHLLNEGEYTIELMASMHYQYWIFEPRKNSPSLNLKIIGGLSNSEFWVVKRPGLLAPIFQYNTK